MSTNLARIRPGAGAAALTTRKGIAGGVVNTQRLLVADVSKAAPAHVLMAARYQRFSFLGEAGLADHVLSAVGLAFGGHAEKRRSS